MPNAHITERTVGALNANGKSHEDYWDTALKGLGLRVYATGKRVYLYRKRTNGKVNQTTMGSHPGMSVKVARASALELKNDTALDGYTLEDFWPHFLIEKSDLKNGTRANMISTYEKYLLPALGSVPMAHVEREDVAALLPKSKTISTRDGVKRVLSTIWSTAMSLGYGGVKFNPALGLKVGKLAKRQRRFSLAEAKALWIEMTAMPALQSAALRVIALSGQRMNQVLSMRWDEIDGPTWKCPARELNKSGRELWIPLSDQVVEILEGLRAMDLDREFVFPSLRSDSLVGHMAGMSKTFARIAKRAGVEDARCHDWRRTFTSFAIKPVVAVDIAATAGLGISLDVAAACLSHAPETNELAWAHYMDAEDRALHLMPERRLAMQRWADFLLDAIR